MSKHPAKSSDKGEGMLVTKKLDLTWAMKKGPLVG